MDSTPAMMTGAMEAPARKKTSRALLMYPPTGFYMRDDRCQAPVEGMSAQPARAPMDLTYIAACLEQVGVTCQIKDYPAERQSWDEFKKDLAVFQPEMLIVSITTPTLERDLAACTIAKELVPGILTVSKGAHYQAKDLEVLAQFKDLDIAIRGESEFASAEIASGRPLSEILGISYRENGTIKRAPPRPFIDDLNKFPLPARHLLNLSLYTTPDTKRPLAFIYTGRGCPHQCIYCAVGVASGYKLKVRSTDSIVKELEECYHTYGIKDYFFRADTFTWDRKWTVELCQKIVEHKLKIRWGANSRVDTIDEPRAEWMKKAGCWVVGFGIESGNQEMLNLMKKRATLDQARQAVALCRKHGIKSYGLFVIGLPWDTRETIEQTIAFAKELNCDFADFNIAYPLPGTEFYEIAKRERLFDENQLTGHDYASPIVRTQTLSTEELIALRKKALMGFYLRPGYVAKTLAGVRSPREFVSYLQSGVRFILKQVASSASVDVEDVM